MPWRAEYRALEADLYDGTAGIGLFLAHLAAVTGEAGARRTAVGALRHATGRAVRREGLHVGSLGVAWAAASAAALLGEEELEAARAATWRRRRSPAARSTSSSAAPARRSPGSRWPSCSTCRASPLTRSRRESGCSPRATVTPHGWSWAAPEAAAPPAPMRAVARRGGDRLGAARALRGDGRRALPRRRRGRVRVRALVARPRDGHVARPADRRPAPRPARALARDRHLVPRRGGHRAHAAARGGAARARPATRPRPSSPWPRPRVCSTPRSRSTSRTSRSATGRRGRPTSCSAPGPPSCPSELGRLALARHDPTGRDWPSGVAAGTTPALFQGLSGIGWWLLRLDDPAIPSPFSADRLTRVRTAA